ncbi:Bacterial regulatory protein, tetR family (plasmid) [Clavibacter michiganensis]|nr:Bacterial regulatory protein, tetR family [Clavibacter michiganensis]
MIKQPKVRGRAQPHERTSQAIREACLGELAERGYNALSMESVAKRAQVGKGALYRRWPDKQSMVASMLSDLTSPLSSLLVWDADTLRSDMQVFASLLDEWLSDPRIVADLISAHLRDPVLTKAVMDTVGAVIGPWIEQLVERARQRGESDPTAAATDLTGALFWRRAVLRSEPSLPDMQRLVQAAVYSVNGA